jgi:hypothetical protein
MEWFSRKNESDDTRKRGNKWWNEVLEKEERTQGTKESIFLYKNKDTPFILMDGKTENTDREGRRFWNMIEKKLTILILLVISFNEAQGKDII